MIVEPKDVRFALDVADELSAYYMQWVMHGQNGFPRSIEDTLWICTQHCGKKVRGIELDEPLKHASIKGFYVAKPDTNDIVLVPGLDPEWRRFVFIKELCHVMLDGEVYRMADIYEHIEESATAFNTMLFKPTKAVVSEVMAEICAMQFFMPYAERKYHRTLATPMDQLVTQYGLPRYLVEKYLSDRYLDFFGAYYPEPKTAPPTPPGG